MTAPRIKRIPTVPYEVCAYKTRTGEVLAWIPCARPPEWERGLNMSGSWSVYPTLDQSVLPKSELTGVVSPWEWSWAVVQGQKIWQAGPVLGERYNEGQNYTNIYGVGIWQMLTDKRGMFNPSRPTTASIKVFEADIPFGTGTLSGVGATIPAANKNLNLRGIGKKIVELMLTVTGGNLPIVLPTNGNFVGTSERDYPGFDMSSPGQRLYELTQVDGGPEVEFIPEFVTTARKFIQHRMLMGDPRLGQLGAYHVWQSGQGLAKVDFYNDGVNKVNRYWERGAGMERNLITGFAQDQTLVTAAGSTIPLLEGMGTSHGSTENQTTLDGYAQQAISTNVYSITTLSPEVTLNGSDGNGELSGSPDLSLVSPGDTGILQIKRHRRLPDGNYVVRISRMRGVGVDRATLDTRLV